MCTQRPPYNWSEKLYQRHGDTFREYLTRKVLPALRSKHDRFLLRELASRWERHDLMNKWMKRFFMYLVRPPWWLVPVCASLVFPFRVNVRSMHGAVSLR